MSSRLQVVMSEQELDDLRRLAEAQGLTLGAWVRRELRAARQRQSKEPAVKLAALARARWRHWAESELL